MNYTKMPRKISSGSLNVGLLFHPLKIMGYPVSVDSSDKVSDRNTQSTDQHGVTRKTWAFKRSFKKISPVFRVSETDVSRNVYNLGAQRLDNGLADSGRGEINGRHTVVTMENGEAAGLENKSEGSWAVFVFLATLQLVFAGRTLASIWALSDAKISPESVSIISYSLCWVQILYMYVCHCPTVRRHFHSLTSRLRQYEATYGFSFDVSKANQLLKVALVSFHVSQVVMVLLYVMLTSVLVPGARKQLYPFHDAEGWRLVAASLALALVMILLFEVSAGTLFTSYAVAVLARREFLYIAQCTLTVIETHQSFCLAPDPVTDTMADQVSGKSHKHADPKQEVWSISTAHEARTDPEDSLSSQHAGFWGANSLAVGQALDYLLRRHEAVCRIVSSCQDCFPHLFPAMYSFGVTIACFLIYSLSSGFIGSGDLPPIIAGIFNVVGSIVIGTIVASSLYDSAKATLQPFLMADISSFSTAMIHKIQIWTYRLTTQDVGFHVYGMFHVNRSTFLTVGGTVLTYAVVVLQMNVGQSTSVASDVTLPVCNNDTPTGTADARL